MTGIALAAGLAVLALLMGAQARRSGRHTPRAWLRMSVGLLPAVTLACTAVVVSDVLLDRWPSWSTDQARWLSLLAPACAASAFIIALAAFRRHARGNAASE